MQQGLTESQNFSASKYGSLLRDSAAAQNWCKRRLRQPLLVCRKLLLLKAQETRLQRDPELPETFEPGTALNPQNPKPEGLRAFGSVCASECFPEQKASVRPTYRTILCIHSF